MHRSRLALVALAVASALVLGSACGSKQSQPQAAPDSEAPSGSVPEQASEDSATTVPGTSSTKLPVIALARGGKSTTPSSTSTTATTAKSAPHSGVAPPVTTAKAQTSTSKRTYDPALLAWCRAEASETVALESVVLVSADVQKLTEMLTRMREGAPPQVLPQLDLMISSLNKIKSAIDDGTITDLESLNTWALINLGPDGIRATQNAFYEFNDFVVHNCPPRGG